MNEKLRDQLSELIEETVHYLPSLLGGVLFVLVGWFLGWFAKRIVTRVAALLRPERFLTRFRWGKDFAKGDVRQGLYNFLGNLAFVLVFLVFLDHALRTWKLTVFSDILEKGIYFFPRMIVALIIFGAGWLIASWASRAVVGALVRERVPRASLIGSLCRAALILFFSAMALLELDVAREIVIIGYMAIVVTSGIMIIVLTAVGGRMLFEKMKKSSNDK
jgi:hypothetical protein